MFSYNSNTGPVLQGQNIPLQLIEFITQDGGETSIELNHDTIDHILAQVGDRPISVINIAGPSRQGKSFILGHMIRRLEGLERGKTDWMGWEDPTKPLEGFKFRNGRTPETKGIWVWSRPFIVRTDENQEVAVLLVDTQGTNDEFSTTKDMSAVVALSLLMSSVMVFNHFTNLQEDIFSALNSYIEYGTLALNEMEGVTPFHRLMFLIRDWNNPGEFNYGAQGGASFLTEKLQVHPSHSPEAKHAREKIQSCFEEIGCFLMPNIGEDALYLDFKGSVAELSQKFAKSMEAFINELIRPDKIILKTIMNSPATAVELKSILETYIQVFNSDEVPSAENMWTATSRMCNNNLVEKSMKIYNSHMETATLDGPYLPQDVLNTTHSEAKDDALQYFANARKIGCPDVISEFAEKLATSIDVACAAFNKDNQANREKFISSAALETSNNFQTLLQNEFPFENNTDFYKEDDIKEFAEDERVALLNDFRNKLCNENEDSLAVLLQSSHESLEAILAFHLNQNKANRSNAEKQLAIIVEELSLAHRARFQQHLVNNKFEENEGNLQAIHQVFVATAVQEYQVVPKPGYPEFHQVFLNTLKRKMEETFNQMKSDHMLQIEEMRVKALESVFDCHEAYKQGIMNGMGSVTTVAQLLQCHNTVKADSLAQLQNALQGMGTNILRQSELDLTKRIEESYMEGKTLFDSIVARDLADATATENEKMANEANSAAHVAQIQAGAAEARAQAAATERDKQQQMYDKSIGNQQAQIEALIKAVNSRPVIVERDSGFCVIS